ncbi:MAG: T9SS type A sorting domain-containing protein [Bacteroidetes bacterium]|nr:T9SS type A sorting domain-containing protein [Bacteroidota bacterium]
MKRALLFPMLLILSVLGLAAQKPIAGQFTGILVPQYSTAGGSGTIRLPVVFKASINNLLPNTQYKYMVRAMKIADTGLTTAAGAGTGIWLDTSGQWRTNSNTSLTTAGQHDTFTTDFGGTYTGWFGFCQSSNAIFNDGLNVYPLLQLQAISPGSVVEKHYLTDSIRCVAFGTTSTKATAIWGKSLAPAKSMVALFDNIQGTGRPIAMTYVEGAGITPASLATFYTTDILGKGGNWGTSIPNKLTNGIRRIGNYSLKTGQELYANLDSNGVWGWGSTTKSTVGATGGSATPIALTEEECALVQPDFQFWLRNSTVGEADGKALLVVRRRYANDFTSSVTMGYVSGTADTGTNKDLVLRPKTINFKPGYTAFDSSYAIINDDNLVEGTEIATISLSNPQKGSIGLERTHSLTITDNDAANVSFGTKLLNIKESAGKAIIKVKMDKALNTPATVRILVKYKGDSTLIPDEFRLGKTYTDTTISLGKSTGPDSLVFFARVIDETVVDPNDTVVLALRVSGTSLALAGDSLMTIIMRDNDRPPVFSFKNTAITLSEKAGTAKIRIGIANQNDQQSDFILRFSPSKSTATEGSDFTFNPSSKIYSVAATDPDSFTVSIPLIDDELYEGNEKMVFTMSPLTNSQIGKPDTLVITLTSDDLPVYKIRNITTEKTAGVADSLNKRCRIYGVVHGVNTRVTGLQFTVIDTSGGIQVFSPTGTFGYTVKEGDSIMVQGSVGQFQGTTQLQFLDTIRRLSTTGRIRNPRIVSTLDESIESQVVRVDRVRLVNVADWPTVPLAANGFKQLQVSNGVKTYTISIDAETNVDGTTAPAGYFNIAGIGGQFDSKSPFDSGYVIVPRYIGDITNLTVPVISFATVAGTSNEQDDSSVMITINVANANAQVNFKLAIKGGTATSNADYNFAAKDISLPAGTTSFKFKVDLFDDNLSEGDETLLLSIRNNNWGTEIGADSVYTLTLKDNESNSVQDLYAGSMQVYPNPVRGSAVQFSLPEPAVRVELCDARGVVVTTNTTGEKTGSLSTTGLSSGLYLVRAVCADGRWYSARLNVQ